MIKLVRKGHIFKRSDHRPLLAHIGYLLPAYILFARRGLVRWIHSLWFFHEHLLFGRLVLLHDHEFLGLVDRSGSRPSRRCQSSIHGAYRELGCELSHVGVYL